MTVPRRRKSIQFVRNETLQQVTVIRMEREGSESGRCLVTGIRQDTSEQVEFEELVPVIVTNGIAAS